MPDQIKRIEVEIFSHEEADRLRREIQQMDELLRAEISRLEGKLDGLHRTIYELIETIGKLRSKR